MRVTTTPAFSHWLWHNSALYPYSNLKVTRNSFFCKWVMLKGQHMDIEEYFPVPANSVPNGLLLAMISSGSAKPIPPELSDIMDDLYSWGMGRNIEWYRDCIDVLGDALWIDREEEYKVFVRYLIGMEVKAIILQYFHGSTMASHLLYSNWLDWFNVTYSNGPKSFHGMAKYSFEYVNWSIAQVNYHAFSPVAIGTQLADIADIVASD
jgi:hypothetical protein